MMCKIILNTYYGKIKIQLVINIKQSSIHINWWISYCNNMVYMFQVILQSALQSIYLIIVNYAYVNGLVFEILI